jgi:hypothetical protein
MGVRGLALRRLRLRKDRLLDKTSPIEYLALGLKHPREKKRLKIKKLEPVLSGKVRQLFRNML